MPWIDVSPGGEGRDPAGAELQPVVNASRLLTCCYRHDFFRKLSVYFAWTDEERAGKNREEDSYFVSPMSSISSSALSLRPGTLLNINYDINSIIVILSLNINNL